MFGCATTSRFVAFSCFSVLFRAVFTADFQTCDTNSECFSGISLLQNSVSKTKLDDGHDLAEHSCLQGEKRLREKEIALQQREDALKQREQRLEEKELALQSREESLRRHEASREDSMRNERADAKVAAYTQIPPSQIEDEQEQCRDVIRCMIHYYYMLPSLMLLKLQFIATEKGFVGANLLLVMLCVCVSMRSVICGHKDEVPGEGKVDHRLAHMNWDDSKQRLRLINDALEVERRFTNGWLSTFTNSPWSRKKKGPIVIDNPSPPSKEWKVGELWPGGGIAPRDHEIRLVHFMWWSWIFIFDIKKPYKAVALAVMCGVIPPMETIVFSWIADGIGPQGSIVELSRNLAILVALHFARDYMYFKYCNEIPHGSVRYELRQRLLRKFLKMKGETAPSWPTGRAVALMDHDVHTATNMFLMAFFKLIRHVSTMIALVASFFYMNQQNNNIKKPAIVVFLSLMLGTASVIFGRHHHLLDLMKRTRDWRLFWVCVATTKIDNARNGKLNESIDQAQLEYSKAGYVYLYRKWHSFLALLSASMSVSEMCLISKALMAFYGGTMAMQGKLTTGTALALLSIGDLVGKALSGFVVVSLELREGYVSLVDIVDVMNDAEIPD